MSKTGQRVGVVGGFEVGFGLQEFANNAELIFKDTERRADLDKWYVKLVSAMFEVITAIANDHHKTPSEVVKMGE